MEPTTESSAQKGRTTKYISWPAAGGILATALLKDLFNQWLEIKLSYALAFVVVWTLMYWIIPPRKRLFGFWKMFLFVLCCGVVFYLVQVLIAYFWP